MPSVLSRSIWRLQPRAPRVRLRLGGPPPFSNSANAQSGHSKWATIKHDKGKNDATKNRQRATFSREIANASKFFGPDPNVNPRLQLAISSAKKAGVPKSLIEGAIARGQGTSLSGAALEIISLEAILPFSIATVIECQTDNRLRTMADLRLIIKQYDGTVTPTNYLFEKRGRVVYQHRHGVGINEVLEPALDANALDVQEDDEGRVILLVETKSTRSTAELVSSTTGLEIQEIAIIWNANEETKVGLAKDEDAIVLCELLEKLHDIQGVQDIYINATQGQVTDATWHKIKNNITI